MRGLYSGGWAEEVRDSCFLLGRRRETPASHFGQPCSLPTGKIPGSKEQVQFQHRWRLGWRTKYLLFLRKICFRLRSIPFCPLALLFTAPSPTLPHPPDPRPLHPYSLLSPTPALSTTQLQGQPTPPAHILKTSHPFGFCLPWPNQGFDTSSEHLVSLQPCPGLPRWGPDSSHQTAPPWPPGPQHLSPTPASRDISVVASNSPLPRIPYGAATTCRYPLWPLAAFTTTINSYRLSPLNR